MGVEGLRRGFEGWEGVVRVAISAAVGARRRIFLETRVFRGGEGVAKGGLRTPSLGVMMNFWLVGGMERSMWMRVERSVRIEVGGKV